MDSLELTWLVRGVGILALLVIAIGLTMQPPKLSPEAKDFVKQKDLHFGGALISLELGGSAELYRLIAGDRPDDPRRAPLRRNLRIDFLFIAAYLLLYTGLAALLAQRGGVWLAVGAAAAVLAAAAAVFDVTENLRTLDLLAANGAAGLMAIRQASVLKWTAISASALLLSALFLVRRDLFFLLGLPLLASGALGVLTGWRGWYAEWCLLAILPALPGIAVLAFRPDWFLRHFA